MNRLYRSRNDRIIAGVAGGIAESWDLDPSIVRIGWVLLALASFGVFLVIYIVMAFIVPIRPADQPVIRATGPGETGGPVGASTRRGGAGPVIAGTLLILLGVWFLVRDYLDIDLGQLWPVILIAIGLLLIVLAFVRPRRRGV
jgi:phage shock protein PspC (stress-responsive transcriptional regulator)